MIRKQTLRLAAVVLALVVLPLVGTAPALAAAPANDDFASATAISSLPYSNALSTVEATVDGDPDPVMTVTLGFDPTGSVNGKTGVAFVTGTVTCSYPGTVNIGGTLSQSGKKGTTISGSFQLTGLTCYGGGVTTNWTATVVPTSGKFTQANATVSANAVATNVAGNSTGSDEKNATVKLGR